MTKKLIGIIEIPKGTNHKYELKDETLILDRIVNTCYPANYGFIADTLCDDGDPIDVFVLSEHPITSLTHVKLELLGLIKVVDDGENDPKLIAKISGDPFINRKDITGYTSVILQFLTKYKKNIKIKGLFNAKEAFKELEKSMDMFNKQ